MDKLTCVECGYENEPERVYCHNCGVKLDRSLLPARDDQRAGSRPARRGVKPDVSRRVRKPLIKPLAGSLAFSAVLAMLVLALMPPDDPPPLESPPLLRLPDIGIELQRLLAIQRRAHITFSETEVNAYLKAAIRSKSEGPLAGVVEYAGTFADLDPDSARVYLVETIYGYPIYIHKTFTPVAAVDGVGGRVVSCGFGRLDLPSFAAPAVDLIMGKLWNELDMEIGNLRQLGAIRIGEERIRFISRQP